MSELTRRDLFRSTAALVAVDIKRPQRAYQRKAFNEHEYKTLTRLAELILPGAGEAGAPEYIDLLASNNAELAAIYTGGLAWLDHESERRSVAVFVDAKPQEQTALLELIAYRENDSPELGPGIRFFDWARKMIVDAYFTSQAGIQYLGYQGNGALARFEAPREALQYVLKRSTA
jgi:gluconate 2-dehydrogenase gamma chain